MRQAWNFTKWLFNRFKSNAFAVSWVISCMLMGAAVGSEGTTRVSLFIASSVILGAWLVKWTFWDGTIALWHQFEREQNEVVDLLKKDYK